MGLSSDVRRQTKKTWEGIGLEPSQEYMHYAFLGVQNIEVD